MMVPQRFGHQGVSYSPVYPFAGFFERFLYFASNCYNNSIVNNNDNDSNDINPLYAGMCGSKVLGHKKFK